jgi:hypothetical protein
VVVQVDGVDDTEERRFLLKRQVIGTRVPERRVHLVELSHCAALPIDQAASALASPQLRIQFEC